MYQESVFSPSASCQTRALCDSAQCHKRPQDMRQILCDAEAPVHEDEARTARAGPTGCHEESHKSQRDNDRVANTSRPVVEKINFGTPGCNLRCLGGLGTFLIHSPMFGRGLVRSNDPQQSYWRFRICPWFLSKKLLRFEDQMTPNMFKMSYRNRQMDIYGREISKVVGIWTPAIFHALSYNE